MVFQTAAVVDPGGRCGRRRCRRDGEQVLPPRRETLDRRGRRRRLVVAAQRPGSSRPASTALIPRRPRRIDWTYRRPETLKMGTVQLTGRSTGFIEIGTTCMAPTITV